MSRLVKMRQRFGSMLGLSLPLQHRRYLLPNVDFVALRPAQGRVCFAAT